MPRKKYGRAVSTYSRSRKKSARSHSKSGRVHHRRKSARRKGFIESLFE